MTDITSGWIAAGASVIGAGHTRTGQPCQDAHLLHETPSGELIIVVADGAGSARYSEEGATTAVQAAVDYLEQPERLHAIGKPGAAWQEILKAAARHALGAVEKLADTLDAPLRELASTLLLVVATNERLFVLQIGDGAIVRGTGGGPEILCQPSFSEYINETLFLVSKGAIEQAQLAERSGPAAPIAVFSDGLQMLALKMPQGVPEPGFFGPLFKLVTRAAVSVTLVETEIVTFLSSERVRDLADDDLTLVLAAPKGMGSTETKIEHENPSHATEFSSAPPESKAGTNRIVTGAAQIPGNIPLPDSKRRMKLPAGLLLFIPFSLGLLTGMLLAILWFHFRHAEVGKQDTDPATDSFQSLSDVSPRRESDWNEACAHDLDCSPFMSCIRHRCRTKAHMGESCSARGEEGGVCAAGSACSRGICKRPRTGTEARKKKRENVCEVDSDCPQTLLCVQSRCTPQRRGPGQECYKDRDCDDAYALTCVRNRCEPRSR